MRLAVDRERVLAFLEALGREAREPATLYLTGGATAVLLGWRLSTKDVDIRLEPDRDELLRAIPRLKESLRVNVELAAPDDFLPPLPGWRDRSPLVDTFGRLVARHYDLGAQALAKVERGHEQDLRDVREMLRRGLVSGADLRRHLAAIRGELYRYPAVDPPTLERTLEAVLAEPI
jgi:hypothetical protein